MTKPTTHHRIEIRLLGPTTVRRQDGRLVAPREWRTSKTLDLLRLLALERDRPVRTERLVDLLWPLAEPSRGRASLRTAVSQLRHLLQPECIERTADGLVLRHAWVDTVAFRALAAEAGSARRSGQLACTVTYGWEAEGLYLRDFQAHDDDSEWARDARDSLLSARRTVLIDAAEAAVQLGWFRDALDLANRFVGLEPTHEGAHRVLIEAYAGLGRDSEALRTYEQIRVRLDEDLGATVSTPTRELHARVVAGAHHVQRTYPRVGNEDAAAQLAELLAEKDSALLISLVGEPGTGRERLVRDACASAGRRARRVNPASTGTAVRNGRRVPRPRVPGNPPPDEVVVLTLDQTTPGERQRRLADVLAPPTSPRTVILVMDSADGGSTPPGPYPHRTERVVLESLTPCELEQLVEQVLGSAPDLTLLGSIRHTAGSLAGRTVHEIEALQRSGRVCWSPDGVTLFDPSVWAEGEIRSLLRVAIDGADDRGLDLIQFMACSDGPVPMEALIVLLDAAENGRAPIQPAVERLTDLGLFRVVDGGLDFHSPALRSAALVWTRPAVRVRLHQQAATSDALPTSARIAHWLAAGHPLAACELAVSGAEAALAGCDNGHAADLCRRADELLDHGLLTASDTGRLRGVVQDVRSRLPRPGAPGTVVIGASLRPGARLADIDAVDLAARIEVADLTGPDSARVAARVDYVGAVLVPARELGLAHRHLRNAARLADVPAERGRVSTWQHLPDVLLGNAAACQDAIASLAGDTTGLPPDVVQDVTLLDCLAAHQLGRPDLPDLLNRLRQPADGSLGIDADTVRAQVLIARERVAEAQAALAVAGEPASPLGEQFRGLVQGVLEVRLGRRDQALATLRRTQEIGLADGCRLLLPELTARLIVLGCTSDRDAALRDFETFDEIVGGGRAVGAENVYRLIARSAIRLAAGHPAGAAAQLIAATELAASLHHPLLAAHCHLAAAGCVDALGRTDEARVHRSMADRYFRDVGMPQSPSSRHGKLSRAGSWQLLDHGNVVTVG